MLQNARETLPVLYNLLTLSMATSYLYYVYAKVYQCSDVMEKFNKIDIHLNFKMFGKVRLNIMCDKNHNGYFPQSDRTELVSFVQCTLAMLVVPLAVFDCFSSMINRVVELSVVGGLGHTLTLLCGSVLEQQFNSCVLATRLRFKLVNKRLLAAKSAFFHRNKIALPQTELAMEIRHLRIAHLKICQLLQLIGDTYQSRLI